MPAGVIIENPVCFQPLIPVQYKKRMTPVFHRFFFQSLLVCPIWLHPHKLRPFPGFEASAATLAPCAFCGLSLSTHHICTCILFKRTVKFRHIPRLQKEFCVVTIKPLFMARFTSGVAPSYIYWSSNWSGQFVKLATATRYYYYSVQDRSFCLRSRINRMACSMVISSPYTWSILFIKFSSVFFPTPKHLLSCRNVSCNALEISIKGSHLEFFWPIVSFCSSDICDSCHDPTHVIFTLSTHMSNCRITTNSGEAAPYPQ